MVYDLNEYRKRRCGVVTPGQLADSLRDCADQIKTVAVVVEFKDSTLDIAFSTDEIVKIIGMFEFGKTGLVEEYL